MSKRNLKIKVDTSQFNLRETVPKVDKISKTGTKRIAENYRDLMRKNFRDESYKTQYGAHSTIGQGNPKSLSHALVVSEKIGQGEFFTVGPKADSMYTLAGQKNYQSYESIFKTQIAGYSGDPYRINLREDRAGASSDGTWLVTYRKPKQFAEKTWKQYQSGRLNKETGEFIKPLLDKEFKK